MSANCKKLGGNVSHGFDFPNGKYLNNLCLELR